MIDIDQRVPYKVRYAALLQGAKISGDELSALCPFHQDRNASLSVNIKSGKYHCHACGESGNYIDFVAKLRGISTADAYKAICAEEHIDDEPAKPAPYNVEIYAAEKRLPAQWLRDEWRLGQGAERDGAQYVLLPYLDTTGKQVLTRKRFPRTAQTRFKWGRGSAGKTTFYGLQHMRAIQEAGYVILVEGESDTQTLSFLGLPALGVPGATMFQAEWAPLLEGLRIYIHVEPDQGGTAFLDKVAYALHDARFGGQVYRFSCADTGSKDPSDLFLANGLKASAIMQGLMANATQIDLTKIHEAIPAAIPDAPVHLRQPVGWQYNEDGIFKIANDTMQISLVCRTPILLTKRLYNAETREEKVQVSFKRDGKWRGAVFPRSMVFQARSIIELADLGATVTSENAKQVVRFLQALEEANANVLELKEGASRLGWQSGGRFYPGAEGGIELDVDASLQRLAGGYSQCGNMADWIRTVSPHREKSAIFRFVLASAFAAPLLAPLHARSFFVFNWCDSRGGKTAALKTALSVWGDPDKLMANFNATQVALERMAGLYCDLPMGIDERQLSGNRQDSLEKTVYMLASGAGRARGQRTGGLQHTSSWRCVFLATGEEPIARSASMTGVGTRTLELVGKPFSREQDAADMYTAIESHYGWAGPAYVRELIKRGVAGLPELYQLFREDLTARFSGQADANRMSCVCVVVLADYLAGEIIFGDDSADAHALDMGVEILKSLEADTPPDVNVQAGAYVADWIASNASTGFSADARGQRLGMIEGDTAYVFSALLNKALSDAGYSPRKTIKWMLDAGVVAQGDGKHLASVKRIGRQLVRVFPVRLSALDRAVNDDIGLVEEVNDDEIPPFA